VEKKFEGKPSVEKGTTPKFEKPITSGSETNDVSPSPSAAVTNTITFPVDRKPSPLGDQISGKDDWKETPDKKICPEIFKREGEIEMKEKNSPLVEKKFQGKSRIEKSANAPTMSSPSRFDKNEVSSPEISKKEMQKQPITSNKQDKKECNDPLCSNLNCPKHGASEKHGKWQGKVHEKKECNDPLCSNAKCPKHGKEAEMKEKEGHMANAKGVKSFADIVKKAEEKDEKEKDKDEKSGEGWDKIEKEKEVGMMKNDGKFQGKTDSKMDEKWNKGIEDKEKYNAMPTNLANFYEL